jgi:hypothetical protein
VCTRSPAASPHDRFGISWSGRTATAALHVITVTRMTHDLSTKAYVEKRLAEGPTRRETRRCLKRYIARHLYRTLNALHDTATT